MHVALLTAHAWRIVAWACCCILLAVGGWQIQLNSEQGRELEQQTADISTALESSCVSGNALRDEIVAAVLTVSGDAERAAAVRAALPPRDCDQIGRDTDGETP